MTLFNVPQTKTSGRPHGRWTFISRWDNFNNIHPHQDILVFKLNHMSGWPFISRSHHFKLNHIIWAGELWYLGHTSLSWTSRPFYDFNLNHMSGWPSIWTKWAGDHLSLGHIILWAGDHLSAILNWTCLNSLPSIMRFELDMPGS